MSLHIAFSWPYSDQAQVESKGFFDKIKQNMNSFPYKSNDYEIALVESVSDTHFVSFLIFTNYQGDDSITIGNEIRNWLKIIDNENYQDYETVNIKGKTVESSLGIGYIIIECFKELNKDDVTNNETAIANKVNTSIDIFSLLKELRDLNQGSVTSESIEKSNEIKKIIIDSTNESFSLLKKEVDKIVLGEQYLDYYYVIQLLECIGKIGGNQAYEYLVNILNKESNFVEFERVICGAVIGLKYVNDKRSIEHLNNALKRKYGSYVINNINEALLSYGFVNEDPKIIITKGENLYPIESIKYFSNYFTTGIYKNWSDERVRYYFFVVANKIKAAFANFGDENDKKIAIEKALPFYAASILADPDPQTVAWNNFDIEKNDKNKQTALLLSKKYPLPSELPTPNVKKEIEKPDLDVTWSNAVSLSKEINQISENPLQSSTIVTNDNSNSIKKETSRTSKSIVNKIELHDSVKCDKCHKNKGVKTQFYYGREVEVARKDNYDMLSGSSTTITKRITCEGSHSVLICNKCVRKNLIQYFIYGIIGTIILGALSTYAYNDRESDKKGGFVGKMLMIFAIASFIYSIRKIFGAFDTSTDDREQYAIENFSDFLSSKGYNKFWTCSEYEVFRNENLKKQNW